MKIRTVEELKSAGSQPATPRETDNVNPATIADVTAGKQAQAPKYEHGYLAEGLPAVEEGHERTQLREATMNPPDLDPGEFPIDALSPAMRDIVGDVANVHRVPVELPAMCAIAIVSGALGNTYTLTDAVNGQITHGNLYVIPAAPKSSGKGSVAAVLMRPLLEASARLQAAFKQDLLPSLKAEKAVLEKRITILVNNLARNKTGNGPRQQTMGDVERMETRRDLEAAQARLEEIAPQLDTMPTYWVGNATSEAMGRLFKRNSLGMLCYSPEGGETVRVLMGKYRSDGKADYDIALSGYSVEPLRIDRITRDTCDIVPCLSMLLLVQPSILRELMGDEEAFERGMTARVLLFIVETEPQEDDGVPRSVSELAESGWNKLIRDVFALRESLAGKKRVIACTPAAREVFRQCHNESVRLRRKEFREIEAELGRWRENAIRIAIVLCVADNPEALELTDEQALRAVKIMRWCARSALRITNASRLQKRVERADELQNILVRSGGKQTLRILTRSHCFKQDEVHSLAAQFPDLFVVEPLQTGGRPSEIVRLRCGSE